MRPAPPLLLVMVLAFALSVHLALSLGVMFVAGLGVSGFAAMQSAILLSNTRARNARS